MMSRYGYAPWITLAGALITLATGPWGGAYLGKNLFLYLTSAPGAGDAGAWLFFLLGVLFAGLMMWGAALMCDRYSTGAQIRSWAVLVIIFTIVAIPFTLFGWIVGGVLAMLGAGLVLRYERPWG